MGKVAPIPPIKTTEVTMIRLTRGTSLEGDLFKEAAKGSVESTIPKAVEVKPNQVTTPATPPTKTTPQPKAQPQTPKPASQQVHLKKSKQTPTPQTQKPKTPTVDDAKISEALGQVQQELKSREAQQAATGAAGPGLPEGTGDSQVPVFGSPKGGVSAQDPAYVQYQATVRSKIIREWIQSGGGPQETAFRCRVKVRVDAAGNVIAKTVIRKSGNESFDLSALRAIERASPLPTPPEQLKGEALQDGLVVDFSSKML